MRSLPRFSALPDRFHVRFRLLILVLIMPLASFCHPEKEPGAGEDDGAFAYEVNAPDWKYELPSYLEEVSGLSFYGKAKIACVQDEKGNIYVLDLEEQEVGSKYDFGGDGDYEDIAVVDETAYVLENNGNIYRVKDFRKKKRKVKKYKTPLDGANDTEGLTYDPRTNSLLIACKGSPSMRKEKRYDGYKAIYRFDLEKEKLEEEPLFLVDLERLDSYIDRNAFTRFSVKVARRLRLIESETSFQPSGIAIHPLSGEIFIISSVGKLLIVLDREGKVLNVEELDPDIFRQPEGICFSPAGDMYISNEGQGGKGYVLKFKFHEMHK